MNDQKSLKQSQNKYYVFVVDEYTQGYSLLHFVKNIVDFMPLSVLHKALRKKDIKVDNACVLSKSSSLEKGQKVLFYKNLVDYWLSGSSPLVINQWQQWLRASQDRASQDRAVASKHKETAQDKAAGLRTDTGQEKGLFSVGLSPNKLKIGDIKHWDYSGLKIHEQTKKLLKKVRLLFGNDHFLVFYKPAGLVCHGRESLDQWVKGNVPLTMGFQTAPLFRLDKWTSGMIVFALTSQGARCFIQAMQNQFIDKWYWAYFSAPVSQACWQSYIQRPEGPAKASICWAYPGLEGKTKGLYACTQVYSVKDLVSGSMERMEKHQGQFKGEQSSFSCLSHWGLLKLETGRRHQIRAQGKYYNNPLEGDLLYGCPNAHSYFLHFGTMSIHCLALKNLGFPSQLSCPLKGTDFIFDHPVQGSWNNQWLSLPHQIHS